MSLLVVDVMESFIAGLDLSSKVISSSDDGTDTTLVVENVFHARADLNRVVDIDGTDYTVLSVDYNTNTIIVSGVIAFPKLYTIASPFYWHGTPISTGNELKFVESEEKVPMAYLRELIVEDIPVDTSNLQRTAKIRLAFADEAKFQDWDRDDHYSLAIRPLCNLVNAFVTQLDKKGCLNRSGEIRQIMAPKWGTFLDRKGNVKQMFTERLDGIELTFDLEICNCFKL